MAQSNENASKWHFNISPYLYLPTFGGDIEFEILNQGQKLEMEVAPGEYLDKLSFAFMFNAEIKKGKWSVAYDLFAFDILADAAYVETINIDLENPIPGRPPLPIGVTIDAGTEFTFDGRQNTFMLGYNVASSKWTINLIAGMRWMSIKSQLQWSFRGEINGPDDLIIDQNGSESAGTDLWNAVIGVKGGYIISPKEKWQIIYYCDLGMGESKFTLQAIGGLSYKTKKIDYKIAYRHINYSMKEDRVFDNLYFSGASFGVTIKL